jgi:late competence protein required for DNA uptake (superfamily II DNA/RNA helicase)
MWPQWRQVRIVEMIETIISKDRLSASPSRCATVERDDNAILVCGVEVQRRCLVLRRHPVVADTVAK